MSVTQIDGTWWIIDVNGRLIARFESREAARKYMVEKAIRRRPPTKESF